MSSLSNELSYLISRESDAEISNMITNAPEEILGDLLYVATKELCITTAKKILARQPDVMKLMTTQGFSKKLTPVHFYLCDDFDFMFMDDDEDFEEKRVALLQLFLKHNADPNWQGRNGGALDTAIQNASAELIKCLLAAGADINQTQKGSALNLIFRIDDQQKRKDILQLLLESGADVNGNAQYRPLLIAAHYNQIDIIQLLLNAGADLTARNSSGKNMLDLAAESQQQDIIDFCASKNWHLDAEQKILLEYSVAGKNMDYQELQEISKRFPENCLQQSHMISFSYAATQLKQHPDAIAWAEKAANNLTNNLAINRYIAAFTYASKFAQAIECFERFQNQVPLKDLDYFAQANLLVAAVHTQNADFIQIILDTISHCDFTGEGAGLLYFNAACVTSMQHKLDQAFTFLVAARLNNFNTSSIDTDSDLVAVRDLPEFSVLQQWTDVGDDFHRIYENGKEHWYFQDKLFEIDFAEQICDIVTINGDTKLEKALAICFTLRDYEQQGNSLSNQMSAAVNSLCEDITTAMMELLDSEDGHNYKGVGVEWNRGSDPLRCQWWAHGISANDEWDSVKIPFTSYYWCDDMMYQQLVESIKTVTQDLFQNREFFIQLGRYSDERAPIKLGN